MVYKILIYMKLMCVEFMSANSICVFSIPRVVVVIFLTLNRAVCALVFAFVRVRQRATPSDDRRVRRARVRVRVAIVVRRRVSRVRERVRLLNSRIGLRRDDE